MKVFQAELEDLLLNAASRLKTLESEASILTSDEPIRKLQESRQEAPRPKRRKSRMLEVAPMKKEKNRDNQIQLLPLLKKPEKAEDFWKWVRQYTHYIPEGRDF